MNLGFIFENFAIIQLWLLNTPDYKPTHADKKSFLEFYENQLNHVAEDFCVKANDISEKLLKNYTLSMNSTLEQQEFKQFLQDFQRDYYHIKRYKQYEPLFTAFINVLIFNYHIEPEDEDDIKEYKFQKTIEQNFADLLKEYESNSTKFFKEKFIPKCEELKQHLSSKQLIELYRTIDRLAACESYHCFPTNINTILMQIDVNYDIIAKYQKLQLKKRFNLFHYGIR